MTQFLGEIQIFGGSYAPKDWAFCDGQLLEVRYHEALFSLLGTMYGGDGRTTFGLPDLRGRVPIGEGQGLGPNTSNHPMASTGGQDTVALSRMHAPIHSHTLIGNDQATVASNDGVLARQTIYRSYANEALVALDQTSLEPVPLTDAEPHENRQPYLALNFIIALTGLYPSRN